MKLDTVAIQIERNKLSAENSKLVAALSSFIESQTIPERLKRKYNILLVGSSTSFSDVQIGLSFEVKLLFMMVCKLVG